MREFKLDYSYRPAARSSYDSLSGMHRSDVDRRIDYLCEHPEPDDEITFAWPEDGPNVFIFYDGAWILTYSLENDGAVLVILSLAPAGWIEPRP